MLRAAFVLFFKFFCFSANYLKCVFACVHWMLSPSCAFCVCVCVYTLYTLQLFQFEWKAPSRLQPQPAAAAVSATATDTGAGEGEPAARLAALSSTYGLICCFVYYFINIYFVFACIEFSIVKCKLRHDVMGKLNDRTGIDIRAQRWRDSTNLLNMFCSLWSRSMPTRPWRHLWGDTVIHWNWNLVMSSPNWKDD